METFILRDMQSDSYHLMVCPEQIVILRPSRSTAFFRHPASSRSTFFFVILRRRAATVAGSFPIEYNNAIRISPD
jgi:hypothetical protein